MPKFRIHHVTKYSYDLPVRDSANQILLYPINDARQQVLSQKLRITGNPLVDIYRDYYGNEVGTFMLIAPHNELCIDSRTDVSTFPVELPQDDRPKGEQWDCLNKIKYQVPFIDFLAQESADSLSEINEIAQIHSLNATPLEEAKQFMELIYNNFKYHKGITSVESTLDEVWRLRAGVCQDFAHVLLAVLRSINIPARYVSGYICPDKNEMRGEGATHAWVEAYIPFYGWLGLDPTNNCIVSDMHVRLAVGRNFSDCSPVKGTFKGASKHKLEVGVSVSYEENFRFIPEKEPVLFTENNGEKEKKTVKNNKDSIQNSYRKYLEMMQQQQQQQQQQ
ncbi:MAG: transglutaminase family protein [Flavobacteriaceae bacterium]|jgi:transglutaminase-like putative cysteine protease|nr:transglutaminase family protein [Flavobacteriaceae bacterium]